MRSTQIIARLQKKLTNNHCLKKNYVSTRFYTLKALPYKITKAQASDYFSNNRRFLEASAGKKNTDALIPYSGDPIQAIFFPMHSASIYNVSSSFVGEYGIDRVEYYWTTEFDEKGNSRLVQQSQVVTDWYNCSGTLSPIDYPFGTKETQIYAGFSYPRVLVEKVLQTENVVAIQPLTEQMLKFDNCKKQVHPHEMNMAYALEKITARVYDAEHGRATSYISNKYSADHVRINSFDVHLSSAEISLHSYFMPAYVLESKVMDLTRYAIVNGYNGWIESNKIYSVIKSTFFGAGVGGLVTWGISAFTRPYLLIPQLLFRIGMGTAASGIFSGTLAKFYNSHKEHSFIHTREIESKQNIYRAETEDDIERRNFAKQMNEEKDYISQKQTNVRLPADKCKLLGLNPDHNINLDSVKIAYKQQIKKWHPDLFREQYSKKIAEEMTVQLNAAHQELSEILKNKI